MRKERNIWSARKVTVEEIVSFQRTEELVNSAKPWRGTWVLFETSPTRSYYIPSTMVPLGKLDIKKYYLVTFFKRNKAGTIFGESFLALKK